MDRRLWGSLLGLALAATAARGEDPLEKKAVAAVSFEGNTSLSDEELRRAIALKPGDPLTPQTLETARRMLRDRYLSLGRADVRVDAAVEEGAAVVFRIREGPLYRFGPTRVEGLKRLQKRVVFRELHYKEGDPFNSLDLFRAQGDLYGLGLFSDIRTTTAPAPGDAVAVSIFLEERPFKWIRGGVGYGSEEKQRFTLSYLDQNLFRRAYGLEVSATVSTIWREFTAEMTNRRVFGTRTEHRSRAGWRSEDREGYDLEMVQARTSLGRRLFGKVYATPAYRLQRTITFNVTPEVAADTPENSLTSAVEGALTFDSVDEPFFPRRGMRAAFSGERAGGLLGGDLNFNKVFTTLAAYFPLFGPPTDPVVAALQARGGAAWPFDPSEGVPVFERFFTGGANTVRGHRERGVGPKDPAGNPLGGDRLTGGMAEVRFPLWKKIHGAAFLDGGMVGDHWPDVEPAQWRWGAGAGLRYVTPVGPLRLDVGWKLDSDPSGIDEDAWRVHFSLGEAF